MSQRHDDPRTRYGSREPHPDDDLHDGPHGGPEQYGQEHSSHRQHGQFQNHQPQYGQSWDRSYGQNQFGQRHLGPNDYGQRTYRNPPSRGGRDHADNRDYRSFSQEPFAQQPSGHSPFSHAAFGESNQPRYFGTGAQGYGGGPSFTGGTYGTADERSDAPYFQDGEFSRDLQEEPQGHELDRYRRQNQGSLGARSSGPTRYQRYQQPQRRYPAGPKGYQRSDERLREDISERLMQSYDIDSSDVTVQVQGGKVVLEGTVPDRYMKHAIEDLADAAPGVQDVDNRIRVGSQSASGTTQPGAPSVRK